jgi:hypothetical protein
MDLKYLTQKFVYRIEAKPEGGFIARAADPTVPALEAPTREELQQKIQAKVITALGERLGGLKIPVSSKQQGNWEFHIDRKPEGGFSVHSEQQGPPTVDPATHQKIDHTAEEVLGFVEKHFPDLSKALAEKLAGQNTKVFTEQGDVTPTESSPLDVAQLLLPTRPLRASDVKDGYVKPGAIENSNINGAAFANTPITPEAGGNWKLFRVLLLLAIVAALLYFFLLRR